MSAVRWIAWNIIANEIHLEPFPKDLLEPLAQELVSNPNLGWPDLESARDYLESEYSWQ